MLNTMLVSTRHARRPTNMSTVTCLFLATRQSSVVRGSVNDAQNSHNANAEGRISSMAVNMSGAVHNVIFEESLLSGSDTSSISQNNILDDSQAYGLEEGKVISLMHQEVVISETEEIC